MKIKQLFDNESCTYTYILCHLGEAVIIDPVITNADRDLEIIQELDCQLIYTVETHIHGDHITAADYLRRKTGCKVLVPSQSQATGSDFELHSGDVINFGDRHLVAKHTPGHTYDSFCYWLDKKEAVFTGDTLLIRKCGRADFQNGDPEKLYNSIQYLYSALFQGTVVYPGHDYTGRTSSTIGEEKKFNERCKLNTTLEEFLHSMSQLKAPYPKLMDRVVPINLLCGASEQCSGKKDFKHEVLAIDIDDTVLTTDGPPMYNNPKVIDGALETIEKLSEAGYVIDFYTARHSNLWDITNKQLLDAGFKFRRLVTNKHPATIYIDDRALHFTSWEDIKKDLL